MNTAPEQIDQAGWTEELAAYFTFGPGGTVGVWVLTILGIILMIVSIIAWFIVENRKLEAQVARLKAAGLKTETMPGGEAHHTPSEA